MSLLKMNKLARIVPVAVLAEAVDYNPNSGVFVWKERPVEHFQGKAGDPEFFRSRWNNKYAGKRAFTCRDPRGYAKGMLNQKMVWAHRVAIALATGAWPDGEVDHINRDKSDNRLTNLRVVTHQQNAMNRVQGGRAGRRT